MVSAEQILLRLRDVKEVFVDQAMAAALPTADPVAGRMITKNLLERQRPEGLLAAVLQFHRLSSDAQDLVSDSVSKLDRSMREAAKRMETRAPANVIRIIARARAIELVYILVDLLRHGSDPIRRESALCLLELAKLTVTSPQDTSPWDPRSVSGLREELEDLVRRDFYGRDPKILRALLALAPRPIFTTVLDLPTQTRGSSVADLCRLLQEAAVPEVRRALLSVVAIPALTDAALGGLSHLGSSQVGFVPDHAHLLLVPGIRQAVGSLRDVSTWTVPIARPDMIPIQSARGLPRWIATLPLRTVDAVQELASLSMAADASIRLAALRELLSYSQRHSRTQDTTSAIIRYCDDPDLRIARLAIRELIRRNDADLPSLLLRQLKSKHEHIRAIAGRSLAPIGFDRLWQAWPKMDPDH